MDLTSYLMGKKASGGGSGASSIGFEILNDETTGKAYTATPQEIMNALNSGKDIYFYMKEVEGDLYFYERYAIATFGSYQDFQTGNIKYDLEIYNTYMQSLDPSSITLFGIRFNAPDKDTRFDELEANNSENH